LNCGLRNLAVAEEEAADHRIGNDADEVERLESTGVVASPLGKPEAKAPCRMPVESVIGDVALLGLVQDPVDDDRMEETTEEAPREPELGEGPGGLREEERAGRARSPGEPVAADQDVGVAGVQGGVDPVLKDDDVGVRLEWVAERPAAVDVGGVELLEEVEPRPDELTSSRRSRRPRRAPGSFSSDRTTSSSVEKVLRARRKAGSRRRPESSSRARARARATS
jgi:hypothetical protein